MMEGLCRNTSAGKSCSITSWKNSHEFKSSDGSEGFRKELSIERSTCRSCDIKFCHLNVKFDVNGLFELDEDVAVFLRLQMFRLNIK